MAETDDAQAMKVKSDALRLLSFRPRSVEELKDRLRLKKHPEALIEEVIGSFRKQGLLDDTKFAKLYAESRVYSRPTGKRQLEADLKKKGLSSELVSRTIAAIPDYDEKKMAKDLVWKRFNKMAGIPDEKKKARLFGFLKRRGFETNTIFSVIEELFKI